MNLIDHPLSFYQGTRVMFLRGRNKDGVEHKRKVTRVSHSEQQFALNLEELWSMARDGERIYASAAPRNLPKAVRTLKERMLANDYAGNDQLEFYRKLESRWVSALMNPGCELDKVWMFDLDEEDDYWEAIIVDIAQNCGEGYTKHYSYRTKNGFHVITKPFNPKGLRPDTMNCLNRNPMMLWGY